MRREHEQVGFWQDDTLAEYAELVHAFSERGANGEFNLALHTGDEYSKVIANREKWAQALGINLAQMVTMEQVHGTNIAIVGKKDCGRGMLEYTDALPATDGLITNEPQVALFGCFADCVPLFFYDPKKRVIALSHGGWRGAVAGIAPLTAKKMADSFGSDYADILVAIAPAIGACHYEVDEKVIKQIEGYPFARQIIKPTSKNHGMLDLPKLHELLLLDIGVKQEHIFQSEICTYCHNDSFFSYRAENGKCGRMAGTIMLK